MLYCGTDMYGDVSLSKFSSSCMSNFVQDCAPSSLSEFDCEFELSDTYNLHWAVSSDASKISFGMQAATGGYVALGFSRSGGMVNTDAVIGSSADGVVPYELLQKSESGVNPDQNQRVFNASVEYDAGPGLTFVRFTRLLDNGGASVVDLHADTAMVWAHSENNSSTVEYHGSNRGPFSVNFGTGAASITDGLKSEPAIIAHGSGYNYVQLHGSFMVVTFAFLLPIGILVARFGKAMLGKSRIALHGGIQTLAVLFAVAGLLVATKELDAGHSAHRSLGITLLIFVFFQPIWAALRPKPDTPHRFKWYRIHWAIGMSAIVMGFINMFKGIQKAKERDGMLDSYKRLRVFVYVGMCGCVALGLVLELIKRFGSGGRRDQYEQII